MRHCLPKTKQLIRTSNLHLVQTVKQCRASEQHGEPPLYCSFTVVLLTKLFRIPEFERLRALDSFYMRRRHGICVFIWQKVPTETPCGHPASNLLQIGMVLEYALPGASSHRRWRTENGDQRGGEWEPQISFEIFSRCPKITAKYTWVPKLNYSSQLVTRALR
jgi:hypothetical protein